MNLVSTIVQFLAPAIVNKIAGSLGLGQGVAGKLISAAIPAILAGLTGSASKSGGGALLSQILGKQDPGLLGNFAGMLGGAGQQKLIEGGSSALGSLLGGSSTNALAGALGKFAGASEMESKSLLGMLAPVVLGSLAKEQKSSGLDAAGLVSLLNGQKSNVAAAMPDGFANLLSGTGLLDSIAGNLKAGAAPSPAPSAEAKKPVYPGNSTMYWLLAPVALAALVLYWMGNRGEAPMAPPSATSGQLNPAAMASQVTSALDGLKSTLGGIADEASAKAALPKLQDTAGQIDKLKSAFGGLPSDAKKPVASLISGALPGLTGTMEKILGIPGVAAILKPLLDQMLGNLNTLAKA